MAPKETLLTLASLEQFDEGGLRDEFNDTVKALTNDCMDRPGISQARKITVEIALAPLTNNKGTCESVSVTARCKHQRPPYGSPAEQCRPTRQGVLFTDLPPLE